MNVFDRKYCIVDSSGNYYRINEYDALVVAKGEESAQWFDILEANKRISESGMSKSLRTVAANKQTTKKKAVFSELDEPGDNDDFSMEEIDFNRLAKELSFIQTNYQKYLVNVKEQQTAVDEEICDILHFIELYQHDDAKAIELVDQIQKCRERRRSIKDKYYQVETFGKLFTVGGISNVLKDITKRLDNMETREYIPRRLPQLFIKGVKKTEELLWDEEYTEEGKQLMEEAMEYERHATIFDEVEMDWGEMVSQQAEIFSNIGQHMINLQLDIEDLDGQIEDLMIQCEDTNCNVTQGYKMFKQLKELRLIRKEKLEELNKVSVVADAFDCDAIADVYRYCADTLIPPDNTENEPILMSVKENMQEESDTINQLVIEEAI